MRLSFLRFTPSHRLRRSALVALTLLALLATIPQTVPVGANETAPTPPTWLRVNGGRPGLYERFTARHYVGRERAPVIPAESSLWNTAPV